MPVASTAPATPVGAIVADFVRVAGTTTGVHIAPPSVVCRRVGADPVQTAQSVDEEAATTFAGEAGQGALRLAKWPPRSEDAHRRAPPAGVATGTAAIQTDVPDTLMLAFGATDVNGNRNDLQWPVATPARCNQTSLQPVLSQCPVNAYANRLPSANATTPCKPVSRHLAPPSRVTHSGARGPDGDAVSRSKANPSLVPANRTVSITAVFAAG